MEDSGLDVTVWTATIDSDEQRYGDLYERTSDLLRSPEGHRMVEALARVLLKLRWVPASVGIPILKAALAAD